MPSFATPRLTLRSATRSLAITLWPGLAMVSATATSVCEVRSTPERTPVIELYTPQVVVNGRDWRNWQGQARLPGGDTPALASIELRRTSASDGFEALIRPADASRPWTATVTVTEDGHASRVSAGENAGATLQHDFIVRQLTPLGQYRGAQSVRFAAVAAQPGHLRRINLVVNDGSGGEPLQAVSMACP